MYRALLRIGWNPKSQKGAGSHVRLQRDGWPDYTWAWHDSEELGPAAMRRIAKHTGLTPEDL